MNSKKLVTTITIALTVFIVGFTLIYYTNYFIWKTPIQNPAMREKSSRDYDILVASEENPNEIFFIKKTILPDYIYNYGWFIDTKRDVFERFEPIVSVQNDGNQTYSANITFELKTLNKNKYVIQIPNIELNMDIKTEPQNTKVGGSTLGPTTKIINTKNDEITSAYAAILVGTDNNYHEVDVEKLGIKTDWIMFWDSNWNFYHLDKTVVSNPTSYYYNHSFLSKTEKITRKVATYDISDILSDNSYFQLIYNGENLKLVKKTNFNIYEDTVMIRANAIEEEYKKSTGILIQMDYSNFTNK